MTRWATVLPHKEDHNSVLVGLIVSAGVQADRTFPDESGFAAGEHAGCGKEGQPVPEQDQGHHSEDDGTCL